MTSYSVTTLPMNSINFILTSDFSLFQILAQELDQEIVSFGRPPGGGGAEQLFSPIVTATCRAGIMTIKLETVLNFIGVLHSR